MQNGNFQCSSSFFEIFMFFFNFPSEPQKSSKRLRKQLNQGELMIFIKYFLMMLENFWKTGLKFLSQGKIIISIKNWFFTYFLKSLYYDRVKCIEICKIIVVLLVNYIWEEILYDFQDLHFFWHVWNCSVYLSPCPGYLEANSGHLKDVCMGDRRTERTDGCIDKISPPCSTGHRPLSGPLLCLHQGRVPPTYWCLWATCSSWNSTQIEMHGRIYKCFLTEVCLICCLIFISF